MMRSVVLSMLCSFGEVSSDTPRDMIRGRRSNSPLHPSPNGQRKAQRVLQNVTGTTTCRKVNGSEPNCPGAANWNIGVPNCHE
jgi:hypothetical protein